MNARLLRFESLPNSKIHTFLYSFKWFFHFVRIYLNFFFQRPAPMNTTSFIVDDFGGFPISLSFLWFEYNTQKKTNKNSDIVIRKMNKK